MDVTGGFAPILGHPGLHRHTGHPDHNRLRRIEMRE